MKKDVVIYYKQKRDFNLENKPLAAFYQILIIQEVEKRKLCFNRKSALMQLRHILDEMLDEILEIDDVRYRKGIIQEVLLAGSGHYLSDNECCMCNDYFKENNIREYVYGAYQIHINGLLDVAKDDVETAQMYADNLLMLLRVRYGERSIPYAKMKLHIIGEYFWQYKKDDFIYIFKENYEFLKQYTMHSDVFFCDVLFIYTFLLGDRKEKDYDFWMAQFEEAVEQWKEDVQYCFLQCKIAWIKAKMLEKEGKNEEGFTFLQNVIREYLREDPNKVRPFYACVYLLAAYFSGAVMENDLMLYYAKEGLAICEKLNSKGSELYYNLYNYIGIWYMRKRNWGEAEKLYGNMIPKIVHEFGKENENFVSYMTNLALTVGGRGRDATAYFKEITDIKSEELKQKFKKLMNNELNYSVLRGDSIGATSSIYQRCIHNIEGIEDQEERERLDTLYLQALINAQVFDEKTEELLKGLEKVYENRFADDLAIIYWNSRMNWVWKKGRLQEAYKIAENLMREINATEYIERIQVIINNIQLLVIHRQYEKAKERILFILNVLDAEVLKSGYGNSWMYLLYIRILLSMCIHALKRGGIELKLESGEAKLLLEKIIRCKTIEREIKGLMGKYDDEQEDFYHFKLAHRKLAALEIARNVKDLDSDYDRKKMEYLLELEEYESSVSQKIPFHELIHTYKLEEIEIPHDVLCAEYFAYYNFVIDEPMLGAEIENNEKGFYSYLVFVLAEKNDQSMILEITDIPIEETLEEEWCCLLEAANSDTCGDKEIDRIRKHLHEKFATPVLKYVVGKKLLYLGVDYELQMLPIDLIFYDDKEEPINSILLDSVCYIGEEDTIDIGKSDALIIGNPKLNLHGEQKEPALPCGELECIRIAEMFGTKAYIGIEAHQKVLWGKRSKDIIHISTHGEFKMLDDAQKVIFNDNICVCSFLEFAGYEDWKEGRKDIDYGNGIVSGDDFLFMNLSGTKLVVLSACESGLGYLRGLDTMHGMRWAISAAGASNSVTALWKVPEAPTAILMLLFYRNLHIMPISEALYLAKKCLRRITVAELREDKELQQIIEMAQKSEMYMHWYKMSEGDRPFSHWKYWAGFVCYHR